MPNISSAESKMNTDEIAQDKPLSEALFSKLGANINKLIDNLPFHFEVLTGTGSWVAPSGITKVLVIAVGGGGGGGGGGEGHTLAGSGSEFGVAGSAGSATTFNSLTVVAGGSGGFAGGHRYTPRVGETSRAGTRFDGSAYGAGGAGGAGGNSDYDGGGGGSGQDGPIGFKVVTVVPTTSYGYVSGAGGAGGAGGTSTGVAGSAGTTGSIGAILLIY